MKRKILLMVLSAIILLLSQCKKQKLDPACDGSTPSYNPEIKQIIDGHCISCHSGGTKDFRTYDGLKPYLDNGKFRIQVLEKQRMPKGSDNLSQEELNAVQCWVDNGYQEN